MAKLTCLLAGCELENAAEDFRAAQRVEQYRLSERAVYIPAGLRWNYLPLRAVGKAEESHRSVTAGKCVAVTERRPTLLLEADGQEFTLPLEKPESLRRLLDAVGAAKA